MPSFIRSFTIKKPISLTLGRANTLSNSHHTLLSAGERAKPSLLQSFPSLACSSLSHVRLCVGLQSVISRQQLPKPNVTVIVAHLSHVFSSGKDPLFNSACPFPAEQHIAPWVGPLILTAGCFSVWIMMPESGLPLGRLLLIICIVTVPGSSRRGPGPHCARCCTNKTNS